MKVVFFKNLKTLKKCLGTFFLFKDIYSSSSLIFQNWLLESISFGKGFLFILHLKIIFLVIFFNFSDFIFDFSNIQTFIRTNRLVLENFSLTQSTGVKVGIGN